MKKINYILIATVFLIASCTEFLTLEPQDDLIREEYWKTQGHVESVLGTSYAKMGDMLDDIYFWAELRGGLLTKDEKRVKSGTLEFFNYNVNEYNVKVKWDDFYEVINLANTLIEFAHLSLENDKTFNQDVYNGYMAEAHYIRSLCYFYLVKAFRDVPFITSPYATDEEDFNIEKSPESEIIEHLISDLNEFSDLAFSPDHFETISGRKGRINANAFYALLAELYLWNDDYDNCLLNCSKIKSVFLVGGENYFSIFGGDGNSLESIFELQFDYFDYQTTNILYEITSQNQEGQKETVVSEYLIGLYTSSDLRQNGVEVNVNVTYNADVNSLWKYEGIQPYVRGSTNFNKRDKETSDANWIFYRFADIHLMKAEAYAEKNDLTNAIAELNIIKNRAGIGPFSEVNPEKERILAEILDERARELVGEGKRWFDLVRIARRDVNNRLNFIVDAVIPNVEARSRSAVETKIKDMDSWYLPIFNQELLLNKKLQQNPFYE